PAIRDLQNVLFELAVRQHEHPPLALETIEDALPDVCMNRVGLQIQPKDVDRVVVPILDEDLPIHDDRALLIGLIDDDADNRQMNLSVRRVEIDGVAKLQSME